MHEAREHPLRAGYFQEKIPVGASSLSSVGLAKVGDRGGEACGSIILPSHLFISPG